MGTENEKVVTNEEFARALHSGMATLGVAAMVREDAQTVNTLLLMHEVMDRLFLRLGLPTGLDVQS